MHECWRITLLGGLQAERDGVTITRFRTQKTAALFAYLALFVHRAHPREELTERFWPESDAEAGRSSLRTALASLRRQLEPPGVPAGAVLIADSVNVRLNPAAVTVDTAEFEAALAAVSHAAAVHDPAPRIEQMEHLLRAAECYRGELLPGFYDDWVLDARERLAQAHLDLLRRGRQISEALGDMSRALVYAREIAAADPFDEEACLELMQLLVRANQSKAALAQYQKTERLLHNQMGEPPGQKLRALAAKLRAGSVDPADPGAAPPDSSAMAPAPRSEAAVVSAASSPAPVPPADLPARVSDALGRNTEPRLPLTFTRFFGRDDEIARIGAWLRGDDIRQGGDGTQLAARLITLTGPGGAGKTRLAVEAARRLNPALFAGRIWFVPLADITDACRLPGAILDALRGDRPPRPSGTATEEADDILAPVVEALREQGAAASSGLGQDQSVRLLLVLDNFEQITDGAAPLVRDLLERIPALACLVTSRQRLEIEGEHELYISPLPIPTRSGIPERLLEFASVQLFADRARLARPDFQVTRGNAGAIARLCERLEGVPLALELAAPWVQTLTPAQMLGRLERRLDLLASRRRDVPERHRSLRAAMEWSYRLLTPELRRFFARLSVFRGGWTLAAAEAVCCADADEEEGVSAAHSALEHLTQLRERSLVTAEETAPGGRPEMRFRLLETLREYGAEQLPAPERAALERRHRDYYLRLAEEAERKIEGPDQAQWLDRLEIEHDNLRAALDRCCPGAPDDGEEKTGHGEDAEAGLRLAGALWGFWRVRGHWREGRERLMACLRRAPAAARTGARAKALYAVGSLSGLLGDYTAARALCEESLAIAREREDGKSAGDALHTLGILVLEQGDVPAARAFLEESLTLRRAAGDRAGMAASLLAQGDLVLGNMPSLAFALYQESLALRRALGDQQGIAGALNNLGEAARYRGEDATARSFYAESLAISREIGDKRGASIALGHLALIAQDSGDYAAARAFLNENLALRRELGDRWGIAYSLEALAHLAAAQGDEARGAVLWGAGQALREAIGAPLPPNERPEYERMVAAARARLGEDAFAAAWARGRTISLEQAIAFALEEPLPGPAGAAAPG